MSNPFFLKYTDFLRKHNLYDYKSFHYIFEQSIWIEYKNNHSNFLIDYASVFNKKGQLQNIVPCIPYLNSESMVVISIYAYVSSLLALQNIGKENYNSLYFKTLPLFYQKLYILENESEELLKLDKIIECQLLKDGSKYNQLLLENRDNLIKEYFNNKNTINKTARKIKRYAREYLNNRTN